MEVDLSKSIDRYAQLDQYHPQQRSPLPWSVCLPLLLVFSLIGWAAISLPVLIALGIL